MGNSASSSKPSDFVSGYVGLEIHHAGKRGMFKKDPRVWSVVLENGPVLFEACHKLKNGCHISMQTVALHPPAATPAETWKDLAAASAPLFEFVREDKYSARDAEVIGPAGKPICSVRRGSNFKFEYHGKFYRWQRRPQGSYVTGFKDHATFKLVEMHGETWGETVASLHLTTAPEYGRAGTLYMPAAAMADPELQGLLVITALVVLKEKLLECQRSAATSAAASSSSSAGAAAAAAS